MAGLSFNPEGHHIRDGRTLAEIIADEEYLEPEEPKIKEKEEKEEKKFKFMSFELDMKYPRTLRGFMRILQILLLLVAFICLIITSWENQGVYSFYCVFLIFGALVSGFLFFTLIAGSRKGSICGLSWVKVELIYFIFFGFIIFIGACLAASNSGGNPALNAGAAFGFIAVITFVVYIFWTWKDYKNSDDDEDKKDDEDDENKEKDSQADGDDVERGPSYGPQGRNGSMNEKRLTGSMIDPPEHQNGDLRIDAPQNNTKESGNFGGAPQYRHLNDGTRSLERPLSIISRNELIDPKSRKDQHNRRPRSGSDKDSAYSEGSMVDRNRSLPTKMRRTASARADERQRSSGRRQREFSDRRKTGSAERRPPQELSAEILNQEDGRQRKSVPSWLRAALDDDEAERGGRRLVSTMPAPGRGEFPLLHMSDEESIAYPSVSQTLGNGDRFGPRFNNSRGRGDPRHVQHDQRRRGGQLHRKTSRNHGQHGVHGRGGKRFGHAHGHRHIHGHVKRQMHGPHRGQHRRGGRHGRGHGHHRAHYGGNDRVRPEDDVLLRKMVGNDQLVHRSNGQFSGPGNNRRVYLEQPATIHFPEKSRWDDNEPGLPDFGGTHNMIEKYLNDQS
ncbi:uncharacterized protein LOC120342644 isoform X1 [Styela clava]